MKKELNNKGFSLVELIIVIAIMAVLMGVLAPQYLKYVKQSKISTDITNAQEIATAINTAVADQANATHDTINIVSGTAFNGGDTMVTKTSGGTIAAPNPKAKSGISWVVEFDTTDGVKTITLDGAVIWPTSSAYETQAATY